MTKRTSRFLVPFLAIIFLAHSALADELTGKVLDPDGRAVPNASLRLFERNSGELRTTKSSTDGSYTFREIAGGDYLLEADASDSTLKGARQVIVKGNQTENLNLKISSRSTEISVTANSTPLSAEETGKAIDVIDSAELALRNEFSIADALRTLPGVRVQTLEGPGSFTEIKTRGLRAQDTAFLIDGMRFHDAGSPQNDATAFLGDLTIVDTDRIEFLRGSGSSLYGSNALGGVVNITSRPGGSPTRGALRVEGGGLGMVRGVGNLGGGFWNDRISYSGGASHLYVTDGVRNGLPYRNNSLQGTAKFSLAPGMTLTGRAWYSSNYIRSTESPTLNGAVLANSNPSGEVKATALPISELEKYEKGQPFNAGNATFIPNAIDPDGRRGGSFASAVVLFQHQISSSTSYRVAYQAVDTRRTYLNGPQGPGSFEPAPGDRSNFNGYVDTFQARMDQRLGNHHLITFGYELEQERYFSFNGGSYGMSSSDQTDLRQRSHALYIQDQISLLDSRLQLTASGRSQFFDLKDPVFQGFTNPYSGSTSIDVPTAYTGDGAMAYFFESSRTKFRGHVGNSFRAPSGYERFGGGSGFYYGDPRLAPERAISVDGGFDQWLLDSRIQLSGTVFYTNLQQTIRFVNTFAPGTDPYSRIFGGYANGGGGIARGLEFSGRFSPGVNTKLQASYTFVNSDSRTPTIAGTDYYSILDVSPHVFTVTATHWITRRTNVTFDMAAHSDYTMTLLGGGARQFRFDGPIKGDVMLRHELNFGEDRAVEIYGKIENVFNQRAYEDGYIGPRAWFITGARIAF